MPEISRKNLGKCKCCGEERLIYKDGFCQNCYKYKIKKKYILNPKIKNVSSVAQYGLINEISEKQTDINVGELARKYGLSRQRVYKIIESYFDIVYIRSDNNKQFQNQEDLELELTYKEESDTIIISGIYGKRLIINASDLRNILLKEETM